jgi:excisionase family DNA binding protein
MTRSIEAKRTLVSMQELAKRWGVADLTLRRLVKRRKLRSVRIGRRHMVAIAEIERIEKGE